MRVLIIYRHVKVTCPNIHARHGPFSSILPFSPGGASKLYQYPRRFARRSQAQAEHMRPFLALFTYPFPDTRAKTRSFRHDRASHPSSLRFYVFLSRACARHPHKRSPTRLYDRYASDRTEHLRLVFRVIKYRRQHSRLPRQVAPCK